MIAIRIGGGLYGTARLPSRPGVAGAAGARASGRDWPASALVEADRRLLDRRALQRPGRGAIDLDARHPAEPALVVIEEDQLVGAGASLPATLALPLDQYLDRLAEQRRVDLGRDSLLHPLDGVQPLALERSRHVVGPLGCLRAGARRVHRDVDDVEADPLEQVERGLELEVGLAAHADDDVGRERDA